MNPIDFGSDALVGTAYSTAPQDGVFQHVFTAWLSLFREAESARAANNNVAVPAYTHTLVGFNGVEVLSTGGAGWGRFAGQLQQNVRSHEPGAGTLRFVQTPDSTLPQLAALFIPTGLDASQPVPINVFFTPSTSGKRKPYPYSTFADGTKSYDDMIHSYLVSGDKRLLNQHVGTKRRCTFVLPVPPPGSYYSQISTGEQLRLYCQEIAFWVARAIGTQKIVLPRLGRCALSAFSEGGVPLNNVIGSMLSGSEFPELAEAYCLDVVSPAGSSTNTASYQVLLKRLNDWVTANADRRVRIYTEYPQFDACVNNPFKGGLTRTNGGSQEYQTSRATFVYTPQVFWTKVQTEQTTTAPSPGYNLSNIHQVMPCIFLKHALGCSGFQSL